MTYGTTQGGTLPWLAIAILSFGQIGCFGSTRPGTDGNAGSNLAGDFTPPEEVEASSGVDAGAQVVAHDAQVSDQDAAVEPPPEGPYYGPVCPEQDSLPQIAVNEGPFTLCRVDADCPDPDSHACYGVPGEVGFCHSVDADTFCDGDEVHLQISPPGEEWESGICVPPSWHDFMCCEQPAGFVCPAVAPCDVIELDVFGSNLSPTDGCIAEVECGDFTIQIECDGENDGTFTSLCGCDRGGLPSSTVYDTLYEGEGEAACLQAARDCGAKGI